MKDTNQRIDNVIQPLITRQKDQRNVQLTPPQRNLLIGLLQETLMDLTFRETYVARVKVHHGEDYVDLPLSDLHIGHAQEICERALEGASNDALLTVGTNHLALYRLIDEMAKARARAPKREGHKAVLATA